LLFAVQQATASTSMRTRFDSFSVILGLMILVAVLAGSL